MQNAKEIFEGRWTDRPYEVAKKGKKARLQDQYAPGAMADAVCSASQHPRAL